MSIVVRFNPVGLTKQQYDETDKAVGAELGLGADELPDGCQLHVCFGQDGDLRVSEIWDSREQFEAFGEKLMPVLAKSGVQAGQPDVYEVHKIVTR